jgi:hypothetical protein
VCPAAGQALLGAGTIMDAMTDFPIGRYGIRVEPG